MNAFLLKPVVTQLAKRPAHLLPNSDLKILEEDRRQEVADAL
jgi:hypothetical protein